MNHKYNDSLTFKIENEMDLHVKVVSFLKVRYPHSLLVSSLVKIKILPIRESTPIRKVTFVALQI